jgi:hypothetical protein
MKEFSRGTRPNSWVKFYNLWIGTFYRCTKFYHLKTNLYVTKLYITFKFLPKTNIPLCQLISTPILSNFLWRVPIFVYRTFPSHYKFNQSTESYKLNGCWRLPLTL